MHIFKSVLHYIKYYKLALNTFQKGNAERYFFKVARLLQTLIGNGKKEKKTCIKKIHTMKTTLFVILYFRLLLYVTFVRNNDVSGN